MQGLRQSQTVPWDHPIERWTRQELHRDEVSTFMFGNLMNGDNAGMIERGGGFRFLDEAPASVAIADLVGRKDFDRDEPVEMDVACLVDDTHAAFAKLLEDLEVPERLTDHGRQFWRS